MRTLLTSVFLLAFIFKGFAQISEPIKWTYSAKKVSDKTYDIYATATLDAKWHIYAQEAGEGPEPTSLTFTRNPLVKLDGKVKEVGQMETAFDPNFNSTLKFYSNKVSFVQRVKMKSSASTVLKGNVYFMVCNDKKCLPPKDQPFSVKLPVK
jgi:thiol:disulfide interchange protein DsbD